jgi:GNAT superfamily N-acetyltransferase
VCIVSGDRLAWRRVLAVRGDRALVRGDVAPFADGWVDGVVGRLVPRRIDRIAAVSPSQWTELGWTTAIAGAHAFRALKRLRSRAHHAPSLTAKPLLPSDWPRVRAFWLHVCGSPMPLQAHPSQHVAGLFLENGALAGVTIQIVLGDASYSAYTLVDRRFRGLGGGRRLLEVVVDVARGLGVKLLYAHIDARNLSSIAAHEAAGFRFARWWTEESDPLLAAERQWRVYERDL